MSRGERDLAAESMFEYGARVGFWRLKRLFDERDLPFTLFACALALERNPDAAAAVREDGIDICCHGWRWTEAFRLTEDEERDHIRRAVESLERTTGRRPDGWYCRYGPSVNTRRLLVEEGGFLYDSDAYNDELPYWVEVGGRPHLVVPYSLAHNDGKFAGAVATGGQFFEYLRDAVDFLREEGRATPRMMSVGLHLRLRGPPRARRRARPAARPRARVRRCVDRDPRRDRPPLGPPPSAAPRMLTLALDPLTAAAFAPFGDVPAAPAPPGERAFYPGGLAPDRADPGRPPAMARRSLCRKEGRGLALSGD